MTDKRPSSTSLRRAVFDRHKWVDPVTGRILLTCHICLHSLDPAREKWDAEHVLRRSVGGSDDTSNVLPAHRDCHTPKTAKDVTENAKGKRVSERHFGIKRSSGFGWSKRFRKKLNGEVVER
jgi:5-methylcytosine-specific restriction protein A